MPNPPIRPFHRQRPQHCRIYPTTTDRPPDSHCPVCDHPVYHYQRPGRRPIYCSNACRQHAYRWRKQHCIRLRADEHHRADNGHNGLTSHALRDDRDPVHHHTHQPDSHHPIRTPAACGAYVIAGHTTRRTHHEFLPESPWACKTCANVIGDRYTNPLDAYAAGLRWSINHIDFPEPIKQRMRQDLTQFEHLRPRLDTNPDYATAYLREHGESLTV